jgi:hypothetical protein
LDILIPILFWSSILLSLALSVLGAVKGKYWLLLTGAVLFLPICYYFNGSPVFHGYFICVPAFQVMGAAAVRQGRKVWAWLLLAPAFLTAIWFFTFATLNLVPE